MKNNFSKTVICKILKNIPLNKKVYTMTISCQDTSWIKPGKFFNIKIPGFYLRRPMAVSDYDKKSFSFIYEVVGDGTKKLSTLPIGSILDILVDLGNHFVYHKNHKNPLLVCGGSGIGPIICFAKSLKKDNIAFDFIAGFPSKENVIYVNEIKKVCPNAHICTDDGSFGEQGNVVAIINKHGLSQKYYYACGSNNMLKALTKNNPRGQVSLDERMGCGFGACMGCSIKTKNGEQRICKNGPIFNGEDLLW